MSGVSPVEAREAEYSRLVRRQRRIDTLFAICGLLVLIISMGMLATLLVDLFVDGFARIDGEFLTEYPSRRPAEAGILSAWVGTTVVMVVTAALAVPLGVGAGLYLEEYRRPGVLSTLIEVNVANLAGVPSIIYGLLALGLFVYGLSLGQTVLVAGMTLALLILPVIIVATREAIRSIPVHLKEGAYGIGCDQWQVMWHYVLPAARPGVLTGIIVGLSRAIGETAPVITIGALTFIAFLPPAPVTSSFPFLSFDWLDSAFTVMPIQMFNWVSRPQADFHENAAATGLVLLAMTLLMNALAVVIRFRLRSASRL